MEKEKENSVNAKSEPDPSSESSLKCKELGEEMNHYKFLNVRSVVRSWRNQKNS